jgi:hypothetical protein
MSGWQEISAQFYGNRLLFGDPAERGIVAVEIASRTEVEIFKREGDRITRERRLIPAFRDCRGSRCSARVQGDPSGN